MIPEPKQKKTTQCNEKNSDKPEQVKKKSQRGTNKQTPALSFTKKKLSRHQTTNKQTHPHPHSFCFQLMSSTSASSSSTAAAAAPVPAMVDSKWNPEEEAKALKVLDHWKSKTKHLINVLREEQAKVTADLTATATSVSPSSTTTTTDNKPNAMIQDILLNSAIKSICDRYMGEGTTIIKELEMLKIKFIEKRVLLDGWITQLQTLLQIEVKRSYDESNIGAFKDPTCPTPVLFADQVYSERYIRFKEVDALNKLLNVDVASLTPLAPSSSSSPLATDAMNASNAQIQQAKQNAVVYGPRGSGKEALIYNHFYAHVLTEHACKQKLSTKSFGGFRTQKEQDKTKDQKGADCTPSDRDRKLVMFKYGTTVTASKLVECMKGSHLLIVIENLESYSNRSLSSYSILVNFKTDLDKAIASANAKSIGSPQDHISVQWIGICNDKSPSNCTILGDLNMDNKNQWMFVDYMSDEDRLLFAYNALYKLEQYFFGNDKYLVTDDGYNKIQTELHAIYKAVLDAIVTYSGSSKYLDCRIRARYDEATIKSTAFTREYKNPSGCIGMSMTAFSSFVEKVFHQLFVSLTCLERNSPCTWSTIRKSVLAMTEQAASELLTGGNMAKDEVIESYIDLLIQSRNGNQVMPQKTVDRDEVCVIIETRDRGFLESS